LDISKHYSIPDCVARWGNAVSIALFDPACKIFSTPHAEGIIGYRLEAQRLIVFGDPLCAQPDMPTLVREFHAHFQPRVKNILYVAASEKFTDWALQHVCHAAIHVGNEIIIDPAHDPRIGTGKKASDLRRNCSVAARYGIHIHEYTTHNTALEKAIEAVGIAWVKARKGPQTYSHPLHIFDGREHKRWFYAQHNEDIVGVLILNRIDAYQGWVISFLIAAPGTPTGTSELLVIAALEALRQEGCTFLSIGPVPGPALNRIEGLGRFATWFARNAYNVAKKALGLGERQRYWKKFKPKTQDTYIVLSKPHIGIGGVVGIMRAFNARV